jgi:hypothetical protein
MTARARLKLVIAGAAQAATHWNGPLSAHAADARELDAGICVSDEIVDGTYPLTGPASTNRSRGE